jgi:translation initiation factor 1
MNEIDPITGLPKELFDIKDIEKEQEKIKVRVMQRRFGKVVTIISGFQEQDRAKEMGKALKKKLACGGTVRGTEIELQGDHKSKVKEILRQNGYKEEHIDA